MACSVNVFSITCLITKYFPLIVAVSQGAWPCTYYHVLMQQIVSLCFQITRLYSDTMPCFVVAIFKWDCYVSQRHNISQVSFSMSIGHAMPMRPNKAQTAVHRCLTSAQLIWLCICLWWWPRDGACISIGPPYFLAFFNIHSFIHPFIYSFHFLLRSKKQPERLLRDWIFLVLSTRSFSPKTTTSWYIHRQNELIILFSCSQEKRWLSRVEAE